LSLLDAFEVRIRTDFDPSHVHVGVSAGPAWDPFRPGGAARSQFATLNHRRVIEAVFWEENHMIKKQIMW
jgi:hypothetical protein